MGLLRQQTGTDKLSGPSDQGILWGFFLDYGVSGPFRGVGSLNDRSQSLVCIGCSKSEG